MKKSLIILLFLFGCVEPIQPRYRATVVQIEQKGKDCIYILTTTIPYLRLDKTNILAPCGKYKIGEVIYFN